MRKRDAISNVFSWQKSRNLTGQSELIEVEHREAGISVTLCRGTDVKYLEYLLESQKPYFSMH